MRLRPPVRPCASRRSEIGAARPDRLCRAAVGRLMSGAATGHYCHYLAPGCFDIGHPPQESPRRNLAFSPPTGPSGQTAAPRIMSLRAPLVFKTATEDWEIEAIHRLNYKTFVEEIPQHKASPTHRLVDKFHAENTYLICLSGRKLAGMLAVRGNRPFSLDQKLEQLDSFLPSGRKICEIRLLAVEKKFRGAQVLQGILALLWQHGIENGYDLAIISGTPRQVKLYHHLGFVPFGPMVGTGDAQFQPMYVTLETFEAAAREFLRSSPSRAFQPSAANFLPGPVAVRREVRRAFEQAPESHRSGAFVKDFHSTRQILSELTRARHTQLLLGSGTLANDVVAAQLSLEPNRGVILSNGEFGE